MKTILDAIKKNFKVTTATQVGLDTKVSSLLIDYFWSTTFIDDKSDWTSKVVKDLYHEDTNIHLYDDLENSLFEELDYLEYDTDFVYIHNRHSADFRRNVFSYFTKRKTKFVLVHPQVITSNCSSYKKNYLHTSEGTYKLYYLDLMYEELSGRNSE